MVKTTIWDDKKLVKLKTLWEKGIPITQIGIQLGVSRNSIAGKAHRLGLPKRSSPISNNETNSLEIDKITSITNLDNIPLKLLLRKVEWTRTKCCWPLGDPKLKGFKFCGEDIVIGRPYCNKHSHIAYTNAREN